MGQTKKRKRTSKHRGNAAGIVEARGRTGRKLTVAERKQAGAQLSRDDLRRERMREPPTWKGAFVRGAVAAVLLVVILITVMDRTVPQAVLLGAFVVCLYVPAGYYLDGWMHQRRLRKDRELARR